MPRGIFPDNKSVVNIKQSFSLCQGPIPPEVLIQSFFAQFVQVLDTSCSHGGIIVRQQVAFLFEQNLWLLIECINIVGTVKLF